VIISMRHWSVVVAGGGAAGFFAAITARQTDPAHSVLLLEKNRSVLTKVRISGGGRCNVTHACFDPNKLVQYYPRGSLALKGPFSRFQPQDTVRWFEERKVMLKQEADGRMFPVTDSSQTIIDCLEQEAKRSNVEIRTEAGIEEIEKTESGFLLKLSTQEEIRCDKLLLATGSSRPIFRLLETLGHRIEPLVPSLFTFNIPILTSKR
jgi:predicted Rossmann fold flavoprotein